MVIVDLGGLSPRVCSAPHGCAGRPAGTAIFANERPSGRAPCCLDHLDLAGNDVEGLGSVSPRAHDLAALKCTRTHERQQPVELSASLVAASIVRMS